MENFDINAIKAWFEEHWAEIEAFLAKIYEWLKMV